MSLKRNHVADSVSFETYTVSNDTKETIMKIKHGILMLLCCLLPIILLALVPLLGIKSNVGLLFLLICPLMYIFMMKGMKHNHDE